jgi:tetratricopeptide (TPR) repeat protein
MQAVMSNPANLNFQNNMAALLTNNGYPENAIPYLNTIQQQLPNNSTVKNNLGYAWLNLGEIDSAQRILTAAAALNPEDPETTTGTGVIQEKKGNTEEAGKKYEEAFVESPSSMGEMILQNARRGNPYDNMTFDQIKDKITIYEYFKKEWITIPNLSNSVDGYQADIGILNGYTEMFKGIMLKIQAIEDSIRNAKDTQFPTEFNRTAQNILIPIASYKGKYALTNYDDDAALEENVKKTYKKAEDDCYDKSTGQAAKCEVQDNIYTAEYLQKVNPDIKRFFENKLEKQRVWINAFITYRMLVMNPQPKQQLLEVLYYSKLFIGRVAEAIAFLKYQSSACNATYNNNAITVVNPYDLPKFLCPVSINSIEGVKNNNNISKSASSKTPNVSIAFESGDGSIAEPGKGGTPYVKTSLGEVNSSGYNGQDAYGNFKQSVEEDDLTPLTPTKEEDDLTPLAKILKQEDDLEALPVFTKDGDMLAPLVKIIEKHNLKKWLQDQLATNCDDLKKRDPNEETMKLIDALDAADELKADKQNLQKKLDQLNQQNNPANAEEIASGNKIMEEITKGQQRIEQKNKTSPGWADKISGIAPTIVNSLQSPGTIIGFIKGLFD